MKLYKKLVIVVAVNGGMQQSRGGAIVPTQPEEIAEAARLCREAGASVVHFHGRDKEGKNTGDLAVYAETIRAIRRKTDILIQTTNGIGVRRNAKTGELTWPTDEERLQLLNIEPQQDLFGIAGGSMDFYNPGGGYPGETPYINSSDLLKGIIPSVLARGAALEVEVTEASIFHKLLRLADEGVFDRNAGNMWFLHGGGFGATPADPRAMQFSIETGLRAFPNNPWGIVGTGRDQGWIAAYGIASGCDTVRVGFEDSLYRGNGEIARHNHQFVEDVVKIARTLGREPATPDEAREILGVTRRP
jgi:3-keto-5-aminohexanoate cleavage enzyme